MAAEELSNKLNVKYEFQGNDKPEWIPKRLIELIWKKKIVA